MLWNEFDSIDKLFFTLTVVVVINGLIYLLMSKFNRPIVFGGILAGALTNHMHLPVKFFDINTCAGLGQMGIVLFMMMIGNQLSYKRLFARRAQIPISFFNLIIPFSMGYMFAGYMIQNNWAGTIDPQLQTMFKAFIGLAVSMTAFPLVSIFLKSTNLVDTLIGRLAMLCGLVDEVCFWVILGVILVCFQKNAIISVYKPIDIIFYLIFIVFIAPKLLAFVISKITSERTLISLLVVGCFASAALADAVDLHQVFGGFLFGLILPHDNPQILAVKAKIGEFVNVILLPIYFVETGMVAAGHFTAIDQTLILLVLSLTVIALLGKFGSAFMIGKVLDYSNKESMFLGSILNIRGIIEVVLLNVGLDVGLLNDRMYTILIAMALICTPIATSLSFYFSKFFTPKPIT